MLSATIMTILSDSQFYMACTVSLVLEPILVPSLPLTSHVIIENGLSGPGM